MSSEDGMHGSRRPVTRSITPSWSSPPLRSLPLRPGPVPRDASAAQPCRLSWDSPCAPPSTLARPIHEVLPPRGPSEPSSGHLPPSWFLTTSTACRSREARACCIPLPTLGFAAFRATPPRPRPKPAAARRAQFPRRVSHPSKNPLAGSRTASPRPLPSCGSTDAPPISPAEAVRCRRWTPSDAMRSNPPPIARAKTSTHPPTQPPAAEAARRERAGSRTVTRAANRLRYQSRPRARGAATPGPSSTDESVTPPTVAGRTTSSFLPWALFPSKVPSAAALPREDRDRPCDAPRERDAAMGAELRSAALTLACRARRNGDAWTPGPASRGAPTNRSARLVGRIPPGVRPTSPKRCQSPPESVRSRSGR